MWVDERLVDRVLLTRIVQLWFGRWCYWQCMSWSFMSCGSPFDEDSLFIGGLAWHCLHHLMYCMPSLSAQSVHFYISLVLKWLIRASKNFKIFHNKVALHLCQHCRMMMICGFLVVCFMWKWFTKKIEHLSSKLSLQNLPCECKQPKNFKNPEHLDCLISNHHTNFCYKFFKLFLHKLIRNYEFQISKFIQENWYLKAKY